jgi:ribosome-associated protein
MIRISKDVAIEDGEVKERFVRASGPGGQNLRKEATAVELTMDIGASSLPSDVKDRLIALAGRGVTSSGVLVVVSRAHRSQARNRDAARARFHALLQRAVTQPQKRTPTRPDTSAREKRLVSKRLRSAVKESRTKGVRGQD